MTSRYTFYDPQTFRVLVREGKEMNAKQKARLTELGFYNVAIGNDDGEPPPPPLWQAWGRKKSAKATVCITKGRGNIVINDEPAATHFATNGLWQRITLAPLEVVVLSLNTYEVRVTVQGATKESRRQPRAIAHALAGALAAMDPAFAEKLWRAGFRWKRLQ